MSAGAGAAVGLITAGVVCVALLIDAANERHAADRAAEHVRATGLTSVIVDGRADAARDPWCAPATWCFQFRGVSETGQLRRGLVRSVWRDGYE